VPVDSEHNSIFQLLQLIRPESINRIILTASGGPFRNSAVEDIKKAAKHEVLNHPTWNMGPKITVDSAGMINKGLEVIEAHFLFGLPYEKIGVVIHPASQVHGMVELMDGSYLMAASTPAMSFPVAHALYYPAIAPARPQARRPEQWPGLDFMTVDQEKYPGFAVCLQAGLRGGSAPAALNGANEALVASFLSDGIGFSDIPVLLGQAVAEHAWIEKGSLADYMAVDLAARHFIEKQVMAGIS
jgi:1-deoxy-D-xylulose-5-phosphate reductoisomerase